MSGRNEKAPPFLQLLERLPLSNVQNQHNRYLLHVATGAFAHILINKKTIANLPEDGEYFYTVREIPKPNGKKRIIHAPDPLAANVGTLLSTILQELTRPLVNDDGFLGSGCFSYTSIPYAMPRMAHRFKNYNYILHFDIKDFFGSMEGPVIENTVKDFMNALYSMQSFKFRNPDFSSFSKQCMLNCTVPDSIRRYAVQGSTLTPIISNLVGAITIDKILRDVVPEEDTYARFSDDIYVGTNSEMRSLSIQDTITDVINAASGFQINPDKTERMSKNDKNKFPHVLSMYCDDNGHLKIPSSKGKLMKVAAFKSGSAVYTKKTFSMHMRYKGYLSYVKSINEFNRSLAVKETTATGAHSQFQGSLHYMEKLESDMRKAYEKGLTKLLSEKIQLSFDAAVNHGRSIRPIN